MFSWERPEYLYLLFVWFFIALIFWGYMRWRKNTLKKIGHTPTILSMIPFRPAGKHQLKFVLFSIAFYLFVLSAANPRIGTAAETVTREGVDLIFALDVSNSMMAEDIVPNRLERAKNFMSRTLNELRGDRVGIIIFAGDAYLKLPLTGDYAIARSIIPPLRPELAPTQGTHIPAALDKARVSFKEGEKDHRVLVLITDAENHEGEIEASVGRAVEDGIDIFVIGVGTQQGAPIPVYVRGVQSDYRRDAEGSIVLSRLNEEAGRQLAEWGGGKYFNLAETANAYRVFLSELEEMERREMEVVIYTDYKSYFQYFLFAGFLILLIESFIPLRKSQWWEKLQKSL